MTQLLPSSRALHILDLALALWVAAWIGLGAAIAVNVGNLTTISTTVAQDGRAVQTIGTSLRDLGSLPLIGGSIGSDGRQVQQAGAATVAGAASTKSSIDALSILLGIAVALLPSVPVFGFYLPARLQRLHESQAVRRALRAHGDDPEFQAFLAQRAIAGLDYRRLSRVSSTPWFDIEDDDRRAALAAAELRRLGINPRVMTRGVGGRR